MSSDGWSKDLFENTVASVVDVTSILVAYQIGVSNYGLGTGLLYGFFDAFIVVWMRKPIARFARGSNPLRRSWLGRADGDVVQPRVEVPAGESGPVPAVPISPEPS